MKYCNVVVDISIDRLDKTFQYKIPASLENVLCEGMQVIAPFGKGNRKITGYVMDITDTPQFDPSKTKEIIKIVDDATSIDNQLIMLAGWMKRNFGSTMNQALKTVIPIKKKSKPKQKKTVVLALDEQSLSDEYASLMARTNHSVATIYTFPHHLRTSFI